MNYRVNAISVTETFKFTMANAVPNAVIKNYYVTFQVLMAVTMKITRFWDVMPCS